MQNIKLTIEYCGTNFSGWQIQGKGERTVQQVITNVLEKILKEKVQLIGSGRTDQGVHAQGQIASFKTNSNLTPAVILRAINANLPDDIVIIRAVRAHKTFHAQYSAKNKTYCYTICNQKMKSVLQKKYSYFYPNTLDITAMRSASKILVGKHNFQSFTATNSALKKAGIKKDTVRTIKKLSITKSKKFIKITIEANGFLYKMVRNIVGTLLEVGSGKISKPELKRILLSKNRQCAGPTAPAQGLCLLRVKY